MITNVERNDIADILLKLALNNNQSINQSILIWTQMLRNIKYTYIVSA